MNEASETRHRGISVQSNTGDAPFLTDEFEPIGGTIKQREEDFLVEEVPMESKTMPGT